MLPSETMQNRSPGSSGLSRWNKWNQPAGGSNCSVCVTASIFQWDRGGVPSPPDQLVRALSPFVSVNQHKTSVSSSVVPQNNQKKTLSFMLLKVWKWEKHLDSWNCNFCRFNFILKSTDASILTNTVASFWVHTSPILFFLPFFINKWQMINSLIGSQLSNKTVGSRGEHNRSLSDPKSKKKNMINWKFKKGHKESNNIKSFWIIFNKCVKCEILKFVILKEHSGFFVLFCLTSFLFFPNC